MEVRNSPRGLFLSKELFLIVLFGMQAEAELELVGVRQHFF